MSAAVTACIGIGSNLDFPARQVRAAFGYLARLPRTRLLACSRLYGNPPMGPQDQPDYVNACAALETWLSPQHLLTAMQDIERRQGRVRARRWGPRRIDLDLLVYGAEQIDRPALSVPHPGIAGRPFVLLPLAEIRPRLVIPGVGRVAELAARADTTAMAVLAPG